MSSITFVGLGSAEPGTLTPRALAALAKADRILVASGLSEYVRGLVPHVVVEDIGGALNDIPSDEGYRAFQGLLDAIVERARQSGPLVVASLGNPLVDDPLARALAKRAAETGMRVDVVAAVSLLDAVLGGLGLDPYADGLQLIGSAALGKSRDASGDESPFLGVYRRIDPARPAVLRVDPRAGALSGIVHDLQELYPAAYRVRFVRFPPRAAAAGPEEIVMTDLVAVETGAGPVFVYLPPVDRLADEASFDTLRYIVARLRGPGGCPWDRDQTYQSIKKHLIEETYEAVDAIDRSEPRRFAEELGDVLLQVVMYAQLGREAGDFTLENVLAAVNAKLVRRHPHVFGEVQVSGSADVLRNWERIKRAEKGNGTTSTFGGVPEAAPALMRADAVQGRATRYGWLPPSIDPDCMAATTPDLDQPARLAALGETLFQVVALARRLHLDPEEALRLATNRFIAAFDAVLTDCQQRGVSFDALPEAERELLLRQATAELR